MKRLLAITLSALMLIFCFAACSSGSDEDVEGSSEQSVPGVSSEAGSDVSTGTEEESSGESEDVYVSDEYTDAVKNYVDYEFGDYSAILKCAPAGFFKYCRQIDPTDEDAMYAEYVEDETNDFSDNRQNFVDMFGEDATYELEILETNEVDPELSAKIDEWLYTYCLSYISDYNSSTIRCEDKLEKAGVEAVHFTDILEVKVLVKVGDIQAEQTIYTIKVLDQWYPCSMWESGDGMWMQP